MKDAASLAPLQKVRHIAVLSGSLCNRSCNRRIAGLLGELAPPHLRLEVVEIARLPPYATARDGKPPAEWRVFSRQIRAADGLLFLASENSRIVPAALKNALDIAARIENCNAWEGKPGAIVNVPANAPANVPVGARFARMPRRYEATRRLRHALAMLDVAVMLPPAALATNTDELFDTAGKPANPGTRKFLAAFMSAFENWIHTCRH